MAKKYGSVPPACHEAIRRLRHVVGISYPELAEGFDISESRVRQIALGYKTYVTPSGARSAKKPEVAE